MKGSGRVIVVRPIVPRGVFIGMKTLPHYHRTRVPVPAAMVLRWNLCEVVDGRAIEFASWQEYVN